MAEPSMLIPLPDDMARLMKLAQRQAAEIDRLRERVFELEADPKGGDVIPLAEPRCGALRRTLMPRKVLTLLAERKAGSAAATAGADGWVAVADGLPEKFTEVLVAFAGQVTLPSTGQWTGNPHDHNGWCYPAENNGICDDGSDPVVTHWMPLPEVPK